MISYYLSLSLLFLDGALHLDSQGVGTKDPKEKPLDVPFPTNHPNMV